MSAAAQARRAAPQLEIVVLEKSAFASYGACGMPYYIAGDIASHEDLLALKPQQIAERGIDARCLHEVREIRPGARTVSGQTRDGQLFSESYDYLVLATGGAARRPAWPGMDLARVFTLRNLEDGMALRAFIEREKPRRAVVIGAGFIGLEMTEAFARRGIEVTLLNRSERILGDFDSAFAAPVLEALRHCGVEVVLGAEVLGIEGTAARATAVQSDHGLHAADLVLVATGLEPGADLARAAGLALGASGAISVDERMRTDRAGLWAAGDCIEVKHVVSGEKVHAPLALTANRTGRVAGDNIAAAAVGRNSEQRFRGTAGTTITKVFDYALAQTGLSPAAALRAGFDTAVFERRSRSRASYYPGSKPLWTRIVVERRTRRLLGAQMVGEEGVGGRIDVLATALFARMSVDEIHHLDLAYAPPFGPVYDAIIDICGKAALEL
ncbi:MAG: NADPH-dependent 2,4-dienoyl-CoA reductase/sulfur reductase-like enzyme [Candidatus Latescibacterota bacterium]|jgi:NADPH-dependent 2,4-dienoyl-CoA reductase/sulfur reductase-like enzyme